MRLLLLLSLLLAAAALLTTSNAEILVAEKYLDSPIEDIQWADLTNVFVVSQNGHLYHSDDGGHHFTAQMERVPEGVTRVDAMFISEKNPNYILFTAKNKQSFHTTDMGKTYVPCPEVEIQDIRLHPVHPLQLLASAMSAGCHPTEEGPSGEDCFKILYHSKDFGLTWESILNYVVQFDWSLPQGDPDKDGARASDSYVYVTAHEEKLGSQVFGVWDKNIHFYWSNDFFKTSKVLVPHGNRFLFGEYSYLFVAAVDPLEETQVSLKISKDNGTHTVFHTARLPGNIHLTEHSYTILDTSEGSVFLHVNHLPFHENAYAGHVYTSDWSGLSYSLSLPYNHRSSDGKCDFEKVEGLEGIYLANFIDEELMEDEEEKEEENHGGSGHSVDHSNRRRPSPVPKRDRLRSKTVITFDKGGEWSYLVPPSRDSHGQPIQCTGECHLHLHGVTDAYGPFYSTKSAVGLIMGTGVVGAYLQQHPDQINTYLSRDAGLTWFEVAKGSHIYEFGNHGALIAMAPDTQISDSIFFSFDQGETWNEHKISEHPLQIENIIIEPEANSHKFIVYGYQDGQGLTIYVDFEGLHERECRGHDHPDTEDSDYETWTPSDKRLNGKCLMGHTVTYVRRKRKAECAVPEIFEIPSAPTDCPCVESDFECDYGYERKKIDAKGEIGECHPMATGKPLHEDPTAHIEPCSISSTYRITKGYRRVPGDTCYGGGQWDAVEAPCPMWFSGSHIGKLILVVLILLAISLIVVMLGSKAEGSRVAKLVQRLKQRFFSTKYKLVGAEQPHSMADDDAFYLSEDEFGPAAHLIDGHSNDDMTAHRRGTIKPLAGSATGKAKNIPILAPPSSHQS